MITRITFDHKQADLFINALPEHIFRATRSATWQTTDYARREMENRLETKTGIPSHVFRRFRVRTKKREQSGLVWVGANMIKATYLGDLSQDSYGAYAGQYIFKGSFVAKMKSGHAGIFKRKGTSRLPIQELGALVKLPIIQVAQDVAGDAANELRTRFVAKVRELNPHIS